MFDLGQRADLRTQSHDHGSTWQLQTSPCSPFAVTGVTWALVAVYIIAGLDFLLTVGYIHRLREVHKAMSDWMARVSSSPVMGGPALGTAVPDFTATTLDGTTYTAANLRGRMWAVGFFAATCGSCRTYLPQLCDFMARPDMTAQLCLVFIDGDAHMATDLVAMARGHLPTVVQATAEVSRAFQVQVYPTLFAIDENGRVSLATNSVDDLGRRLARR